MGVSRQPKTTKGTTTTKHSRTARNETISVILETNRHTKKLSNIKECSRQNFQHVFKLWQQVKARVEKKGATVWAIVVITLSPDKIRRLKEKLECLDFERDKHNFSIW